MNDYRHNAPRTGAPYRAPRDPDATGDLSGVALRMHSASAIGVGTLAMARPTARTGASFRAATVASAGACAVAAPDFGVSGLDAGAAHARQRMGAGDGAEHRSRSRFAFRMGRDGRDGGSAARDASRNRGAARAASGSRGAGRSADSCGIGASAASRAGARPRRSAAADAAVAQERADRAAARRAARRTNFIKYANDNRAVRAAYAVFSGPHRFAVYALVAVIVALSIYFPVRDLYTAYRTSDILNRQLAIRQQYNESLSQDVSKLLSVEGIEEIAREELGLVMPGEQSIDVIGLDDGTASGDASGGSDAAASGADAGAADGSDAEGASDTSADGSSAGDATSANGASADSAAGQSQGASDAAATTDDGESSSGAMTSSEVKAAEQAVEDDAPWYIKILDAFFGFTGTSGQKVASTGE